MISAIWWLQPSAEKVADEIVSWTFIVFTRFWLSLCVELTTLHRVPHHSYTWSAAIGLHNPNNSHNGQADIYGTPWSTELSYVCQYHSK